VLCDGSRRAGTPLRVAVKRLVVALAANRVHLEIRIQKKGPPISRMTRIETFRIRVIREIRGIACVELTGHPWA